MSDMEVRKLVELRDLKVVRRFPIATFPCSETHVLRPIWLLKAIERIVMRIPATASIAQNIVYVCNKKA